MTMTDITGRTKLICLRCDNIDPMKTDAIKWVVLCAQPKPSYGNLERIGEAG
jgi:hypothetical protein